MQFIKAKAVRDVAKVHGRRVRQDFLLVLDEKVKHLIEAACQTKDGGRITMDANLARFVFGSRKKK